MAPLLSCALMRCLQTANEDTRSITPAPGEPPARPVASRERRLGAIVAGAMVVTVLLLFVLLFGDIFTGRAVHGFSNTSNQIDHRY